MDGSSPPSPTQPRADSFYNHSDHGKDVAQKKRPSLSAMNAGRPVSASQDNRHLKAPGNGSFYGGPFAVIEEGEKAPSVGDIANARKNISGTSGQSPYEDGKIPSNSDIRQIKDSSSNLGGYSNPSRPISYNGNHWRSLGWFLICLLLYTV